MARRQRDQVSMRRRAVRTLLSIAVSIAFLLLMINVVLPWAADNLVAGFTRQIEQSQP